MHFAEPAFREEARQDPARRRKLGGRHVHGTARELHPLIDVKDTATFREKTRTMPCRVRSRGRCTSTFT
jgi:hypothetical protein